MVAIHHRAGSFSEKWIAYCKEKDIDYTIIDLFESDLISKLRDQEVTHLLFHVNTHEYRNDLYLKDLVYLLEENDITVFPGFDAFWHYDDKLKQKYLFEQYNIPHAPMSVFYSKEDAMYWVTNDADYPFVFKLRKGAGSRNVKLVKTRRHARKLVNKIFGRGFKALPSLLSDMGPKVRQHKERGDWLQTLLRLPKTIMKKFRVNNYMPRENGYFLVQKFYPDNDYDTRITVIGNKAGAFRRGVREDDFRASGSGFVNNNPDDIDTEMIDIAFEAAQKIGGTSLAFDFIYDTDGAPRILEVSYCYVPGVLTESGGYWDRDLDFHREEFIPEYEIINQVIYC